MGTYYYGVCHTCCQGVGLGKKIWRFDPRSGALDDDEIARLTQALAGDTDAEQSEGVCHGELAFELARLAAFVFEHGQHDLEILPETSDMLCFVEVLDSQWDDPLAHRRKGARVTAVPSTDAREKTPAEDALDQIALLCGCSHWEYPGQVVRDVEALVNEINPCQSCGADPRVSPPSGGELPIIAGALDAQEAAELRAMKSERALEDLAQRNFHAYRLVAILTITGAVLLVTTGVLALMVGAA